MAKKTVAVVEDEDEDVEVEETEAEEADSETETVWGVQDLIKLVKTKTGKDYKPREVRTQLRAMARKGLINREIIPGNKQRYSWPAGADDPEVKAFIKAVKGGEIEANKKAALDKLKSDKAKKNAAKAKQAAPATKKGSKAAAPDPDEEEDEDD